MSGEVIMYRKIFIAVLVLGLLAGCEKNISEVTEEVSETGITSADIFESGMAESASTTVTTVSTVVSEEAETSSETSAKTETEPPYIEDGKPPVVMSAEELYEAYPVKIIYAERCDVSDRVRTEILQEDICNSDGLVISKFYAEYPVLFGYDEAVCEGINVEIHDYIYGAFEDEKKAVEEYNAKGWNVEYSRENGLPAERNIDMDGTFFDGFGYDINGNIFSVYFANNSYGMVDLHGFEYPVPMMFDLRTGDKINFSELVGDNDSMNRVFAETYQRGAFMYGEVPCGELDADIMVEYLKKDDWINNIIKNEEARTSDDRILAVDGCIGFLLAPYENGSFGDGVRLWQLPADEFVPYMNDEGKALFEGYISAETEPPKVVEYKGKRYFDNTEWVPYVFDGENLTEYDKEFISMFENARNADYYLSREQG